MSRDADVDARFREWVAQVGRALGIVGFEPVGESDEYHITLESIAPDDRLQWHSLGLYRAVPVPGRVRSGREPAPLGRACTGAVAPERWRLVAQ